MKNFKTTIFAIMTFFTLVSFGASSRVSAQTASVPVIVSIVDKMGIDGIAAYGRTGVENKTPYYANQTTLLDFRFTDRFAFALTGQNRAYTCSMGFLMDKKGAPLRSVGGNSLRTYCGVSKMGWNGTAYFLTVTLNPKPY